MHNIDERSLSLPLFVSLSLSPSFPLSLSLLCSPVKWGNWSFLKAFQIHNFITMWVHEISSSIYWLWVTFLRTEIPALRNQGCACPTPFHWRDPMEILENVQFKLFSDFMWDSENCCPTWAMPLGRWLIIQVGIPSDWPLYYIWFSQTSLLRGNFW